MQLDTKFSVGEIVYDRLLKKDAKIVGVTVKHGTIGEKEPTYHCCVEYMISNIPSNTNVINIWARTESEIEPLDKDYHKLQEEYITFEKNMSYGFSKAK